MTFSIRLAGLPIGITCTENLAVSRFADYFTDETPVFSVETTKEDLIKEQIMSQKEYLYEGKNCPVFSDGELEYTAVHRKIAEKLPLYDAIVVHGAEIQHS